MRLTGFDLNLLVALDALLAEQSVSRAAERLHVGQPAMSATLARLRSAFDDPLLVRSGRGLQLTVFAEGLRQPLAEVLREVELLLDSGVEFDASQIRRTFSIIASDYVSMVLLRGLLERLSQTAPNISIRVGPADSALLEQLRRGAVDLAIYPAELLPTNTPFRTEPLFEDDFVCVTDVGNPEIGDSMTLDQVTSLPYLAANQGALPSLADQRLDAAGIARNVVMVAQSFVVAPFLLPGTRMYTIVQRRLARVLMSEAHFRVLQPPVPIAGIHEHMVWSPRRTNDAGHRWLRHELAAAAAALPV